MRGDESSLSAADVAEAEEVERRLALGEGGIEEEEEDWRTEEGEGSGAGMRLVDLSLASRYLAAQCQVRFLQSVQIPQ